MYGDDALDPVRTRQIVMAVLDPTGRPLPARPIAERLRACAGVLHAYVSAQTEMAWLIYDVASFDPGAAARALEAMGFVVSLPAPREAAPQLRGDP
jgi:hypothetical protein